MEHLSIFLYILAFALGVTAVSQSVQVYRIYRLSFLRAYIIYVVLLNLLALLNLAASYITVNILPHGFERAFDRFVVYGGMGGFVSAAVMTYVFVFIVQSLLGKEVPLLFKVLFGAICGALAFGYILGIKSFFEADEIRLFVTVHTAMNGGMLLVSIAAVVYLVFGARNIVHGAKRQRVLEFGYLYLGLYACLIVGMTLKSSVGIVLIATVMLSLNLTLLLFLKRFLTGYLGRLTFPGDYRELSQGISSHFKISDREGEIVEMILKGKSNKEIEKELFISPHTVKNHIYNIFQKTGVKSRTQLVNLVMMQHGGSHISNENRSAQPE